MDNLEIVEEKVIDKENKTEVIKIMDIIQPIHDEKIIENIIWKTFLKINVKWIKWIIIVSCIQWINVFQIASLNDLVL